MAGAEVRCAQCATMLEVPAPLGAEDKAAGRKEPVAVEAPVEFGSASRSTDDEMDMTPMVDVTFLLLIFFMVTASFALQRSFEIPAPEEEVKPSTQVRTQQDFEDDPEYVIVRVDSYGTYHVVTADWDEEREAPSEQELLVQLREARSGNAAGVVPTRMLVVANGEALHEAVVVALDAGTAVRMEEVKLVTVEEED